MLDGRMINVELTAGGGGKSESRLTKVRERNKALLGQRVSFLRPMPLPCGFTGFIYLGGAHRERGVNRFLSKPTYEAPTVFSYIRNRTAAQYEEDMDSRGRPRSRNSQGRGAASEKGEIYGQDLGHWCQCNSRGLV